MVVGRLSFAILLRLRNKRYASAAEHLDPGAQPDQTQDANQLCELPPEALQQAVLAAVQREGAPFQTFVDSMAGTSLMLTRQFILKVWRSNLTLMTRIIEDGSQRLHCYVRAGLKVEPAIYRVS